MDQAESNRTNGGGDLLEKIDEEQLPDKLCGYLSKVTNLGLLKTTKSFWFVFSDNTCKLFYYATANEDEPQGEIDIAGATFTFEVTDLQRPGLFYISTEDRQFELEAADRNTCLFWLQELQKRRKIFCRRRSLESQLRRSRVRSVGKVNGGLLRQSDEEVDRSVEDLAMSALMEPVVCPKDIGEEAKLSRRPSRSWSFNVKDASIPRKNRKQTHSQDRSLSSSTSSPSPENYKTKSKKTSFRLKFPKIKDKSSSSLADNQTRRNHCIEDELETAKEVIEVLKVQIDFLSRQNISPNKEQDTSEQQLLSEKDKEIAELTFSMKMKEEGFQKMKIELEKAEIQIEKLKDQLVKYEDAVIVKDQVLIQLTDELVDIPKEGAESNLSVDKEMTRLKDSVEAYTLQNKFLNKEILELNILRNEAQQQEEQLITQCRNYEAKYWQIRSKYLWLLNEMHTPRGGGEGRPSEEVLSQLIQEALTEQVTPDYNALRQVLNRESLYDEFGFARTKDEETLVSAAINSQRISEGIKFSTKDEAEDLIHKRWTTLMLNLGEKELQKSDELKSLIRAGIPYEYKSKIWIKCINSWVKPIKQKLRSDYYQNLLATHCDVSRSDPAAKQIELDLLRTLPNNKHYETMYSDGIPCLRRVLLAYCWHNTEVGYCQGLNRLAAIALLFMNEEEAFWCLVAIVERIMPPGYYSKTLIGSQVDQRVLKELVSEKLPRLHNHFENCKVDLSLFTFNWFLCVFVDNMPMEVYLRVWDTFLYEGSKVLFRFSLAFFKMFEDGLLMHHDVMAINRNFRTMAETLYDVKRISQIAFNEINPLSMRAIKSKRIQHTLAVKAELDELDKLRQGYFTRRETAACQQSSPSSDD